MKRPVVRTVALLSVTLLLALSVAGCGGRAPAPAQPAQPQGQASQGTQPGSQGTAGGAKEPIRIGTVYPFTGSLALLGEESWRGAEIARLVRNKAGGVTGRQIEYVRADAPDVNAAKSETERLIGREGLKLLLGTYSSSLSLAATEVAARAGVPYFELGAIADPITGRGYKYVFRTNPTASMFAQTQIRLIKDVLAKAWGKEPKDVRLAVVHEDSSYGTTVAEYVKKNADEAGIPVVTVEPYSAKAVDLSSVILKLKNANPDAIVAVSYANDAILFWRQAKELDLNVKAMIGTGGGHTLRSFQEALGADVAGILNVDFTQYEVNRTYTPGLAEFVQLYQETFKEPPRSGHSLANYMGAMVLFDILEKTGGDLNPDKIREAALAYKVEPGRTATGWGVQFDDKGQNVGGEPLVMQWTADKLVTVWPESAAVGKLVPTLPTWQERRKGG